MRPSTRLHLFPLVQCKMKSLPRGPFADILELNYSKGAWQSWRQMRWDSCGQKPAMTKPDGTLASEGHPSCGPLSQAALSNRLGDKSPLSAWLCGEVEWWLAVHWEPGVRWRLDQLLLRELFHHFLSNFVSAQNPELVHLKSPAQQLPAKKLSLCVN